MSKQSSKNGIILVGGYVLSPDLMSYAVDDTVNPVDVTGFGEPQNFTPGLVASQISIGAYWNSDAGRINDALKTVEQSNIHATVIPAGYVLGNFSMSMPALHTMWQPQGSPDSAITAGTLTFSNRGTKNAIEHGWILAHATITNTTTGTGVLDPTDGAVTAACAGVLHVWDICAADTYVVKIQHSADDNTYADLVTFTLNGSALGSERVAVASGTINKYRRVVATRTGSAGQTFGYSVHFWHA
jgi:hypothetical protein